MSQAPDRGSQSGHHLVTYQVPNNSLGDRLQRVDVHATEEEIAAFSRDGYLIREGMFAGDRLKRLRDATDEVAEWELRERVNSVSTGATFGGLFLRHLMDKHPAFADLLRFAPTVSVARAMLGPQVQALPMTARISYPSEAAQQTHWHYHQRIVPDPMPPWFCYPHVIDSLIYLDTTDAASGPLWVLPGTHLHKDEEFAANDHSAKPGMVELQPTAGTCVFIHGNLWHRACPTTEQGSVRRLLILPYAATWVKFPSFGLQPEDGLLKKIAEGADRETRELLGDVEGLY